MTKLARFVVSIALPPDCTVAEMQAGLIDHLSCIGGDRRPPGGYSDDDPGDPLFNIDRTTIKVTRYLRNKRGKV